MQKKPDRIILYSLIVLCIFLIPDKALSEDFLLPDWNAKQYREFVKYSYNIKSASFQKIRNSYNFSNFFDTQIIKVHKDLKDISPKEYGKKYLSSVLFNDNKAEKYILRDNEEDFMAVFCSQTLKKCEIVRYTYGFNGLIETKYINNNLWHFQNNIGSYIEFQNRIYIYPYDSIIRKVIDDKFLIRL